jgi:hypothetical protein
VLRAACQRGHRKQKGCGHVVFSARSHDGTVAAASWSWVQRVRFAALDLVQRGCMLRGDVQCPPARALRLAKIVAVPSGAKMRTQV